MREIVKTGVILTIFNLIAGALLAFVYLKTEPVIKENKKAASGEAVFIEVLPRMEGGYEQKGEGSEFPYWVGYQDAGKRTIGGYIFTTSEKGYSSTIEGMIGVDSSGKISGVKILFQQETPGLGDKITEIRPNENDPWFTRQFIGKTVNDNVRVKKDGGTIDAITGATISSRAVTNAINRGLIKLSGAAFGVKVAEVSIPSAPPESTQVEVKKSPTLSPEKALSELLPNMAGGYELIGEDSEFLYWKGYKDSAKKAVGGYIFTARGKGFASTVETLVGCDTQGKITGIKVLSQEETPGYGDKILEIREGEKTPWFQKQFAGKSGKDSIKLKVDGGVIDAITGATITSRAVTKSISEGLIKLIGITSGKPPVTKNTAQEKVTLTPQAEQKKEEKPSGGIYDKNLTEVLPNMAGGYTIVGEGREFPYWIGYLDAAKKPGGYVFITRGEGFQSTIETMVGVIQDGTIAGVKILSQDETPDYGTRIVEIREGEKTPWFPQQFIGKSTPGEVLLVEDGGKVDAITGATISSRAVAESISNGLKKLKEAISK